MYPEDLRYTKTHEWVRVEGRIITLGITFHAQHQIKTKAGGIVYVGIGSPIELTPGRCVFPEIGTKVIKATAFMVVESYKRPEDIFSPADGKITAINEKLTYRANLDLIHNDPYGEGWLVKIEVENFDPSTLMDAQAYQKFLEGNDEQKVAV